jgi:hypothetical protein
LRRILTRRSGDTLLSQAAETDGETAAETVASVELDREDERPDDSRQSDASSARHSCIGYASCAGLQVCSDSVSELIAAFNWQRALSVRMGSIGAMRGRPTGVRTHKPLTIVKELDASSPQFFKAAELTMEIPAMASTVLRPATNMSAFH